MKKRLTSFILVLALSFSLFSVSASAEFTNSDSRTLTDIYKVIQYLNLSPASWQRNSVIGFLERILQAIPSNLSTNFALQGGAGTNAILDDVRKWTMFTYNSLSSNDIAGNLGNIQRNTLATSDRLLRIFNAVATESTLSSFANYFKRYFNTEEAADYKKTDTCFLPFWVGDRLEYQTLPRWLSTLSYCFAYDGSSNGCPTLYRMIHLLQDTLASEDDRHLAENYKENRDQVEQDFLSGQSGPTSLGKGDFSNASQVGGVLNDTFNLGGAAKVSGFLSGFGFAGSESQAWFSQTTANNLNAVEVGDGKSGVSTFADDGETMVDVDPDPYNMRNIFERYDWLEGVNMDD